MALPLLLLLGALHAAAQTPLEKMQGFVKNMVAFNALCPQEKVYVHTDNNGYFADETIWFKVYVVTPGNNRYTDASKVAYVELLSPEGEIIDTKKVEIIYGQGIGEFELKLLNSGFYEIRAYTRSMLNWGENMLFSRVIPIFNAPQTNGDYSRMVIDKTLHSMRRPMQRKELSAQEEAQQAGGQAAMSGKRLNVNFYPEGGNSVAGLPGRVAFCATDKQGLPAQVEGELLDAAGRQVATLNTVHEGRGRFSYTPDGGDYTARFTVDGREHKFALPAALPQGYTLAVEADDPAQVTARVARSAGAPIETVGATLMSRGRVCYFDTLAFDASSRCLLTLPANSVRPGVNQLTLFTERGEVLAERLFFVRPTGGPRLTVRQNQVVYAPYDPVVIEFDLQDEEGNPIPSSIFSLSVRDADSESNGRDQHIASYLLLASELRGYLHNPDYYFESSDSAHLLAADLLMMVQGWRRYGWQQMARVAPFEIKHPIEEGLLIDGKVLSTGRREERAGVKLDVTLLTRHDGILMGDCVTDSVGFYAFYSKSFYDRAMMVMNTSVGGKAKNHRITINRGFSPDPRPIDLQAAQRIDLSVDTLSPVYTFEWIDTLPPMLPGVQLLPEFTLTGDRTGSARNRWEGEDRAVRQGNLYYNVERDVERTVDAGGSLSEIYLWLEEKNKYFKCEIGEQVDTSGLSYDLYNCTYKGHKIIWVINNRCLDTKRMGSASSIILTQDVKSIIICENQRVFEDFGIPDYFENHNIKRADAVANHYVVIFVYLQPGGGFGTPPKGTRYTFFQGYSAPQEFFVPNYRETPPIGDFRRTLHWNPCVVTDSVGHASQLFFNNGRTHRVVIEAEGVTVEGSPWSY